MMLCTMTLFLLLVVHLIRNFMPYIVTFDIFETCTSFDWKKKSHYSGFHQSRFSLPRCPSFWSIKQRGDSCQFIKHYLSVPDYFSIQNSLYGATYPPTFLSVICPISLSFSYVILLLWNNSLVYKCLVSKWILGQSIKKSRNAFHW